MTFSMKTASAIGAVLLASGLTAQGTLAATVAPQLGRAVPTFLVKPPSAYVQARIQANLGQGLRVSPAGVSTIPYWTTTITSPLDGKAYTYSMVGGSPYSGSLGPTTISYVPIVLKIHLRLGRSFVVVDPTKTSHCDTQSASTRFFNSPLFQPVGSLVSNGVNVAATPGGQQLLSAFQRANFWTSVQGSNYGVTLVPTRTTPIVVDWTPSLNSPRALTLSDNCGGTFPIAEVDINDLDTELQKIATAYALPNQIPMTLVADTAIYQGNYNNCCILGYHNAIPSGTNGVQVYAVGAYFTQSTVFGPHFSDITVWTHEMAEMFDDPFVQSIASVPGGVNNALTPAWGHVGQVTGCQNNLEAGDPLTPDQGGNYPNYPITGVGGFTYHYQDLPFHDWFYRTASTSTGGKYSFVGNFASVQGVCV